jgi:hypothetical protein
MQVAYNLNANELDMNFLESIKKLFQNKKLHINIMLDEDRNDTDYLLSSKANANRLMESINNIENRENLVHKNIEDLG